MTKNNSEREREIGEAFVSYCYANELDEDMDYWTTEQEAGWLEIANGIAEKYSSK